VDVLARGEGVVTAIRDLLAASSLGDTSVRVVKLIIAGPRDLEVTDREIHDAVDRLLDTHGLIPGEVVSGNQFGVDRCGERWAKSVGLPVKPFPVTPAEWKKYGKPAGPRRNGMMADYGDALLAMRHRVSNGTGDMIEKMRKRAKPFLVVEVKR
jgi:hypothetical protein